MMIRTSYVPGLDSGGGGGAGGLKEAVSLKTEPIPAGMGIKFGHFVQSYFLHDMSTYQITFYDI